MHQALNGDPCNLAPHRIKGGERHLHRRLINEQLNTGCGLEGADVAPFAADQTPLHLFACELDVRHRMLRAVIRGDPLHCRQDHVSGPIRGLFGSSALKGYAQALRLSLRLFCQSYEELFACRFSVKSGHFSKSCVHRGSCRIKVRRLF